MLVDTQTLVDSWEKYLNWLGNPSLYPGSIKALLLRRMNDYFGNAFGDASAAFRQAAAATAIEEPQ